MCGICGFSWKDEQLIQRMNALLSHRGPNQDGIFTDERVSLGHKRLSIIDLSEEGRQPMSNEDGSIRVVYNGEIYNHVALREELEGKGHLFTSQSDTEVILHAYEEYGKECVQHFNGMFAFALWDSTKKILFLARDRLGIKPLYYHYNDGALSFASEMKSLLVNPQLKREVKNSALKQIIDYAYTINGETLLEGVYELLPGHTLLFNFEKIVVEKYWEAEVNVEEESEEFFVQELKRRLEGAVTRRLMADVPLGASLSGGLDSSAVVALMAKSVEQPIKTFTIKYNDPTDETKEARIVAEHCKTEHTEVEVDFKEVVEHLPRILWHAEFPFARPSFFSGYFLSRGINKKGVIVDLAGSGGDELFAGYNRYEPYVKSSAPLPELAERITSGYFSASEKEEFFQPAVLEESGCEPAKAFLPLLKSTEQDEHLNAALKFELQTELQGVQLIRDDRMSMAHGHEVRVPLLDHTVVELGMQIPAALKWRGSKKYILQKAMEGLLPEEIIYRKKKPFGMPFARFMNEEFLQLARAILAGDGLALAPFVKVSRVQKLLQSIEEGGVSDDNSYRQLLFFTNLELFCKLFLEGDPERPQLNVAEYIKRAAPQ